MSEEIIDETMFFIKQPLPKHIFIVNTKIKLLINLNTVTSVVIDEDSIKIFTTDCVSSTDFLTLKGDLAQKFLSAYTGDFNA